MSERQPERDVSGTVPPAVPDGPRPVDPSELSRYDILLAAIPLPSVLIGRGERILAANEQAGARLGQIGRAHV